MLTLRLPLAAALLVPALLAGQSPPPTAPVVQGLRWEPVGPNRGGRALAVAGSAQRPFEYWMGAAGGGAWKTVDAGASWQPMTDGQIGSASVGALAVAPSDPDVVYLGTGESALRAEIRQGDGVYGSRDGGRTWRHLGLRATRAISRVRVHPRDPNTVFVAALGDPYVPTRERGVYRSRDGGASWQQVLFTSDSAGAIDLVIDPSDPQVLYATLWEVHRRPWRLWSGGPRSTIHKSVDGGSTWMELTRRPGLPQGTYGRIGIAVSPVDGQRVYALVEADDGGVFVSDDGGLTWRRGSDERKLRQRAFYYSRLVADPRDRDRVYVLNVGLWRSDDGGQTFPTELRGPHADHHDLWIAPEDPSRMVGASDGGGSVSVTAGTSWTVPRMSTAQVYQVTTTRDVPYHICGAQQDNTTFCVPSAGGAPSARPGDALGDWYYAVGGSGSGQVVVDRRATDVFYAGGRSGLLTRYDRRTGAIRDVQVYPRFFGGEPAIALPERWGWTFPLATSPLRPAWLLAGSQHVWRSKNDGQFWERISDDLTRAEASTLGYSGGPVTMDMSGAEVYGSLTAIAPSRFDTLTIWAGSDDGLVHVTRDGGKTWRRVTPPALPPHSRVASLEASPHEAGGALLAVTRYQMGDRAPRLYRTRDYGATWTTISDALGVEEVTHVLRADPRRRGLLYAGTDHGVQVSLDDGVTWQRLGQGLPVTPVVDLLVEGEDLVIATHGRGVWVLRDVGPLRQVTAAAMGKAVHLFTPPPALRQVSPARLQYHLARDVARVTLRVRDSTGSVVRAWSAERDPAPLPPSSVPGCERPPTRPPAPGTGAGLQVWSWDLRQDGAIGFDCMVIWGADPTQGPLALPGRYTVELEAGGVVERQPLLLRRDERNTEVDDSDLKAQHTFALRTLEQEDRVNGTVQRLRALRGAVLERRGRSEDVALRALADTVLTGLLAVEEPLYQWRNRSAADPLNYPIKLGNRLHALRRSIETGDGRPTDASYIVLRQLSEQVDRELAAFRVLEGGALARLDARLAALGLVPVGNGGR